MKHGILFSIAMMLNFFAYGQNLLTNGNFESGTTSWTGSVFSVVEGEAFFSSTNSGGNLWDTQLVQQGMSFTAGTAYRLTFRARAAANRNITVAIQNVNQWSDQFRQEYNLTTTMQTFTATFTAPFTFANVQIGFLMAGQSSTAAVYYDDVVIELATTAPPAQPVGFVANTPMVSSVFLAVGPNNVGANNIVYRLYYSPTASAPGDPTTATEYTFGSTGGDANGVGAFGFALAGLTASTQYTFWLYQYNTATMLFSTPASVSATTLAAVVAPTDNAPDPTQLAADVVSIFSDSYTNIATNYNPNWGQSGIGSVNSSFNPGTGNLLLAYPNFNYQGTDVTPTDLSAMEFLHVDVWTNANPANTTLRVSPINFGSGTAEILVTINYTQNGWYSIDIPKSSFTGMTWNDVRQMKFAANGPGSTVPVNIFLDNIYFWKAAALPITLTKIDAHNMGAYNLITWTTASETNNDLQIIERSRNGVSGWEAVGKVSGTNTNEVTSYEIMDEKPFGLTYYRLHAIDYDLEEQFSKIVIVSREGKASVYSLYPNPTSNYVEVDAEAQYEGPLTFNIIDMAGRVMKTETIIAQPGFFTHKVEMQEMSAGIYLLSVQGCGIQYHSKIVKE